MNLQEARSIIDVLKVTINKNANKKNVQSFVACESQIPECKQSILSVNFNFNKVLSRGMWIVDNIGATPSNAVKYFANPTAPAFHVPSADVYNNCKGSQKSVIRCSTF